MALLALDHVGKGHTEGSQQVALLRDVCLELHARELIALWGSRGPGRSTLLRIAAGIEAPDEGTVRFRGHDLPAGEGAITRGIAYCRPPLRGPEAEGVMQALISSQLALGVRPTDARVRALQALERVGAESCEERLSHELASGEAVRVSIATALLQEPALLLVDGLMMGLHLFEQEQIVMLLRSLTREDIAILMSIPATGVGLFAADRALSLVEGRLRGHVAPQGAQVVQMPLRSTG